MKDYVLSNGEIIAITSHTDSNHLQEETSCTKSGKEQLVADFVESGMSKNSWCRKHGIPTSTLNNWLHHNSKKCRTDNENYSFMEISGMTNEINCKSNVQIEYDG